MKIIAIESGKYRNNEKAPDRNYRGRNSQKHFHVISEPLETGTCMEIVCGLGIDYQNDQIRTESHSGIANDHYHRKLVRSPNCIEFILLFNGTQPFLRYQKRRNRVWHLCFGPGQAAFVCDKVSCIMSYYNASAPKRNDCYHISLSTAHGFSIQNILLSTFHNHVDSHGKNKQPCFTFQLSRSGPCCTRL